MAVSEEDRILISGLVCLAILGALAVVVSICVARRRRTGKKRKRSKAPVFVHADNEYNRNLLHISELKPIKNKADVNILEETRVKTLRPYPYRKTDSAPTVKLIPIKFAQEKRTLNKPKILLPPPRSIVNPQSVQKPYMVSFPNEKRDKNPNYAYSDRILKTSTHTKRSYPNSTSFRNNTHLIPRMDDTRVANEINYIYKNYQYPREELKTFPIMLSKPIEIYDRDINLSQHVDRIIIHPSSDLQIVEAIDMPLYYYDQYNETRYEYSSVSSGSTSSVSSSSASLLSREDYYYQFRSKQSIKPTIGKTKYESSGLQKKDSFENTTNLNTTHWVSTDDKLISVAHADLEPMPVEFRETDTSTTEERPIPSIVVEDMSTFDQLEVSIVSLAVQTDREQIDGIENSKSVQTEADMLLHETHGPVDIYVQTEEGITSTYRPVDMYVQTEENMPIISHDLKLEPISVQTQIIRNKSVQTEGRYTPTPTSTSQMTSVDNTKRSSYVQTEECKTPIEKSELRDITMEPIGVKDSENSIMPVSQNNEIVPFNVQHVHKSRNHEILNPNEYQYYFGRPKSTMIEYDYQKHILSDSSDVPLQPTKLYDVNLNSTSNNDIKVRLYRTPSVGEYRQSNYKFDVKTDNTADSRMFDRNRSSQLVSKVEPQYIPKADQIQSRGRRRRSKESVVLDIPRHYLQHERFDRTTHTNVDRRYTDHISQPEYDQFGVIKESGEHFDNIWKRNRFLWYKDIRTQRQPDRLTGVISHLGSYRPDADTPLRHRNYRLHPQMIYRQTRT